MSGNSERDSNVEPVYKVGRRHQQQIIETQLAAPKTETRGAEVFARSNLAVSAADAIALEGRHSQRKAGSESLMPPRHLSRVTPCKTPARKRVGRTVTAALQVRAGEGAGGGEGCEE